MKDKIKEILVDVYQIDGRLEDEAAERILRLFSVNSQKEQLRAFKEFLQSEYNLPVSNRMVDEFKQKQSY